MQKNTIIWSEYQKAIFKDMAKGTGHTIVEAYAGSAKSTTLIESLKYVKRKQTVILLAFNKSIKKEFDKKATIRIFIHAWTYDVSTAIN